MLYVFHVDTGTMLTFDMNLAMESVSMLQAMIEKMCRIAKEKQVLLISGGENLNPSSRVCSYSAGTDTNPIFLFSKSSIEAATPPNASVNYGSETDLRDQVEGSLNMHPSYETVVTRAQLALQFHDVAKEELRMCEHLVHDQHLQHQGWAAVIANLEDITSAFWSRIDVFKKNVHTYLSSRETYLEILARFSEAIQLLGRIPVLPCLLSPLEEGMEEESPHTSPKTLLHWISAQDSRSSLEQMAQQCLASLQQFDEKVKESLLTEAQTLLDAINNPSMKEVKGLEDRLYGLEQLMFGAKKIVQEQGDMAQGFVQNENRARNLADVSVLPDLCNSHRHQLVVMLKNHQSLHDIRRRCMLAKEELSINLHTRLRWVMFIEKSICDIDGKLVIHHETLKKLKRRLEIIQQTYDAPVVYAQAVHEVVRRRLFASQFLQWADNLAGASCDLHQKEVIKRKQFAAYMKHHFLRALFPGFDDSPPAFAVKSPEPFDDHLPAIEREDLDYLQREVPQLSPHLKLDEDVDLRRLLLGMSKHATVDVAVPSDASQTDKLSTSEIVILPAEGDTGDETSENPFYNSRMQALPLLSLAGQLREHVARGDDPDVESAETQTSIQRSDDDDISQSVEVLTDDTQRGDASQTSVSVTDVDSQRRGDTVDVTVSPLSSRRRFDSGHSAASAEFEDCATETDAFVTETEAFATDAFVTADFFIDESLPSSMAESAATRKVVELQVTLQEKVVCLEVKERELEEQGRLLERLTPRLEHMQDRLNKLRVVFDRDIHCCKCDLREITAGVRAEKQEFCGFVERTTQQLIAAIGAVEAESERQHDRMMEELRGEHAEGMAWLQAQLDAESGKLRVTQRELESTEKRVKESEEEGEKVRREMELAAVELKEGFVADMAQVRSELMMEHEIELERTVNDMNIELQEKDRQIEDGISLAKTKDQQIEDALSLAKMKDQQIEDALSLAETRLEENTALVVERDRIADNLRLEFEEEKAVIVRTNDVMLVERLAECERVLRGTLNEAHGKEMDVLRGENEQALEDAVAKTRSDMTGLQESALGELRSRLAEEHTEKLATMTDEWKSEKETELNELRVSLAESHRVTMDELMLSHEMAMTMLRDELVTARHAQQDHDAAVLTLRDEIAIEHESEMLKVREQFDVEKEALMKQLLQEQQQQVEQQQVEQQQVEQQQLLQSSPPGDREKRDAVTATDVGDDGDAACAWEDEKRRTIEEALKTEKLRHETELTERTSLMERDMEALKASVVAEKQVMFNEALDKVVTEKNEVIERLKEREAELLEERERDQAMLCQLRCSSATGDRHTDVSEARLIQQTLEDELASARQRHLQAESELRDVKQHSASLSRPTVTLAQSPLSQSMVAPSVMAESVVTVPGAMTQSVMTEDGSLEDRVCQLRKCLQSKDHQLVGLQHKVMELSMTASSRSLVQDKVSITTCNPGDLVLLCLDEQHDHYIVFTVGTTLHFLHSDCLDALTLRTGPGEPRKSWVLAEIIDKEYCQAKKAQNRFKVPVGTKFYRVKAVPWKNRQVAPQVASQSTNPQTTSQQKETTIVNTGHRHYAIN